METTEQPINTLNALRAVLVLKQFVDQLAPENPEDAALAKKMCIVTSDILRRFERVAAAQV